MAGICQHNQINKRLWWEYCIKIEEKKKKKASCARKILNVKRCGRNFLSKGRFSKSLPPNDYEYAGCSKVVVTPHTQLVLSYETKSQKVVITFYIQRYDKNDIAVDAALQSKLNAE